MKKRLSSYKGGKLVIWILKNPRSLAGFFMALPMLGIVIDLLWYCSAFSRSGAVLVAFAISSVYLSHIVSSEQDQTESINEQTQRVDPSIQPSEKQKILAEWLQRAGESAGEMSELMKTSKEKLSFYEFTAGVCGTLIWAFGDWLPCFRVQCLTV